VIYSHPQGTGTNKLNHSRLEQEVIHHYAQAEKTHAIHDRFRHISSPFFVVDTIVKHTPPSLFWAPDRSDRGLECLAISCFDTGMDRTPQCECASLWLQIDAKRSQQRSGRFGHTPPSAPEPSPQLCQDPSPAGRARIVRASTHDTCICCDLLTPYSNTLGHALNLDS